MDIQRLQFSKNWNNSLDFPTLEESEVQVRADQQLLYDEIKDYLNETLTPAVEEYAESTDETLSEKVGVSTTVNGHPLSEDVTVTKEDVGLGNVDNTSDADKPISTAQQAALNQKADKSELTEVVLGQIPNGSLTTEKLADEAVTSEKLASGSVTEEKLDSETQNRLNSVESGVSTLAEQILKSVMYVSGMQPKYTKYSVDLSGAVSGDIVYIQEDGKATPYRVVQVGNPDADVYDESCDGVWLMRVDCPELRRDFDTGNSNKPSTSTLFFYLNSTYLNKYGSTVKNAIKRVKIPYYATEGNAGGPVKSGADGFSCKVFILSQKEVGFNLSAFSDEGVLLDYFLSGTSSEANEKRVTHFEGDTSGAYTRSPQLSSSSYLAIIQAGGSNHYLPAYIGTSNICSYQPVIILPHDFTDEFFADDDGVIYDEQEYYFSAVMEDGAGNPVPVSQISYGHYSGTGTYGADNPNVLSFPFAPKLLIICTDDYNANNYPAFFFSVKNSLRMVHFCGLSDGNSSSIVQGGCNAEWNENTVLYYSAAHAYLQANVSGNVYHYVAVG